MEKWRVCSNIITFQKEFKMKFKKSFLLLSVALLSVSVMNARKYEEGPTGAGPGGLRPDKVSKELRIEALKGEMKHIEKSVAELKKSLATVTKGSDEYTVLELRRMLKEDYMNGLKGLMDMETGKAKKPRMEMYEEEDEEEFEEVRPRVRQVQKRPVSRPVTTKRAIRVRGAY